MLENLDLRTQPPSVCVALAYGTGWTTPQCLLEGGLTGVAANGCESVEEEFAEGGPHVQRG